MATYRGRIKARSPYYFTAWGTILESVSMQIFIWSGDITTDKPASPQYTIDKTPLKTGDNFIVFEVAELLRDYFEHNVDAYVTSFDDFVDALWMQLDVGVIDGGGVQPIEGNIYVVTDSYGYFEDGINPKNTNDDYTIIVPEATNKSYRFPVSVSADAEAGDYVDIYDGVTLKSHNHLTDGLTSQGRMQYYTHTIGALIGSEDSNSPATHAEIMSGGTNLIYTIYFDTMNDCMQTPSVLKYYGKDGGLQYLYMFGRTKESLSVNSNSYRKDIGYIDGATSKYAYDIEAHQTQTFNVMGKESVVVNSGFIPDNQNFLFKQLFLSEYIWLNEKPVKLTSRGLNYKQNKEDKLINYTLNFEYANNTINDIY